ncbi:unnamed protein product [Somion occarium]|uniref:Uncharacterized protein n=1 Tax=Somion occarium TaxID=3059160 RepID=A0ABP1CPS6_9APHY
MAITPWLLHLLPSLLLLCAHPVAAILVNVTVDDSGPDPITGTQIVYAPPNTWSIGSNCSGCVAHPDPNAVFDRTWHEGTFSPGASNILTATFTFQGSALYVNCILSPNLDENSDMSFFLDGQFVGSFFQPPNSNPNFGYNFTVYTNSSIPYGNHTFTLQNGRIGGATSLVLLDSIVYSYDPSQIPASSLTGSILSSSSLLTAMSTQSSTSTTSSISPDTTEVSSVSGSTTRPLSSKTRTIAIVVSVVGGSLLIAALVAFFLWRRRRYRRYALPVEMVSTTDTSQIGDDPSSSGWAEGTWPKDEEPVHPSLIPLPGTRTPRTRGNASNSSHWSQPSADISERSVSTLISRNVGAVATTQLVPPPGSLSGHDRIGASGDGSGSDVVERDSQHDEGQTVIIRGPPHPFATATPSSPSYPHLPRSPQTPPSVASPTSPTSPLSSRSETPLTVKFSPNRRPDMLPSLSRGAHAIASISEPAHGPDPSRKARRQGLYVEESRPHNATD